MELTSHPTRKGRYISLKQNPGPDKTKKSYVRKYIRKDPIRTRGELMEHFNLSEEDLKQIEEFLINHYKNKKVSVKPTKLGLCPENRRITNAHIKTNLNY